MSVLALIPARAGSKGMPGKNLRTLGGKTLIQLAVDCAIRAGTHPVVTTDLAGVEYLLYESCEVPVQPCRELRRPAELAQDDTPMIAVVQHALEQIPGPPEQVILLVQPTQPFRTPEHLRKAVQLLRETQADSVVSVVELPRSHSPEFACHIMDRQLYGIQHSEDGWGCYSLSQQPTRRQDAWPTYRRDGTVYAFWRKTVEQHGTIYGQDVRPLIIPADESCELDTEADWDVLWQRYWRRQHHAGARLESCPTCGMHTWVRDNTATR